MQLREQREAEEREQGAAAELRQRTAVTPQQLEAVQRRTEEHLRNRAELLAAVKRRQADQQTRLEAAQLQAAALALLNNLSWILPDHLLEGNFAC